MKITNYIIITIMAIFSYILYSCASENREIMDEITITAAIDDVTSKYAVATIGLKAEAANELEFYLQETETGEIVDHSTFYISSNYSSEKIAFTHLKPNTKYKILPRVPLPVKNGEFQTLPKEYISSDIPSYAILDVLEATPTSVRVITKTIEQAGTRFDFHYLNLKKLYYSKSKDFEDAKSISLENSTRININNLEVNTEYYYYIEAEACGTGFVFDDDEYRDYIIPTIIYPLEDNATFSTAPSTSNNGTE